MSTQASAYKVRLFYSYSHADAAYREVMEKALSQLRNDNLLDDWSDEAIVPGKSISEEIRREISDAEIVVFLLSNDFINSGACRSEWKQAQARSRNEQRLFRIPIILRPCPWLDFLGDDDVKALPTDGTPIACFKDADAAWLQVYEGIKVVVQELRQSITPKPGCIAEFEKTLFVSETNLTLSETFVFLRLSRYRAPLDDLGVKEEIITTVRDLLDKRHVMVFGEEMSGKTALSKYVFLTLIGQHNAVLYVDLNSLDHLPNEKIYQRAYQEQFEGDYCIWKKQCNKTLILDNLSPSNRAVEFLRQASDDFHRVVVMVTQDIFQAFYRDDQRFVSFLHMKIEPLTQQQQEQLIRKRLTLMPDKHPITDGYVDRVEDRINSIIISNRIVPRYPFYVLSIMQTYEAFMPSNMEISSYGHCYHALILANLVKSGISKSGGEIDACFNFSEHLAYHLYSCAKGNESATSLDQFVVNYREQFVIQTSTISRITSSEFGIISLQGDFRSAYMFLFFLGRYFARRTSEHSDEIAGICDEAHLQWNYMILLFIIHHTSEEKIIEDIMLRTMCTLDHVEPATLNDKESKQFLDVISAIPADIMSTETVAAQREKERNLRDQYIDVPDATEQSDWPTDLEPLNDVYRVTKTNQLFGQILRNKFGSLKKDRLGEIIEVVVDGGLRLVQLLFYDEDEVREMATYVRKKYPDYDEKEIKRGVRFLSFLSTMNLIEEIVHAVNVPEIAETVAQVVSDKGTPAYELVGYFSLLDSTEQLDDNCKQGLARLLKKHKGVFIRGVVSFRTQHYINTHSSSTQMEQAVCALLKIPYRYRRKPNE